MVSARSSPRRVLALSSPVSAHRARLLPPGWFQVRWLRALQEDPRLADGQRHCRQEPHGHLLGASAIAEFFADIALCPLEVPYPSRVAAHLCQRLAPLSSRSPAREGLGGFYAGFGPILFKQIPYNMAKFATMEVVLEKAIQAYGKPKSELSGGEATFLNLGSGLIAGFAAATISQPRRHALSKINKQKALPGETVAGRITKMAGELGVRGLFGGLNHARLVMVGSITAGQFGIYGELKKALGATNTVEISKA